MSLPGHGDMWSHDVISVTCLAIPTSYSPVRAQTHQKVSFCPSTATSSEFRSNDITSGSLLSHEITSSFPVTWLPNCASYCPVGAQTYPKREFSTFYSHFQVTTGQMTSLSTEWLPWLQTNWISGYKSYALVLKANCIRQSESQLPSSSYNHNTLTTLRTSVRESHACTKSMEFPYHNFEVHL